MSFQMHWLAAIGFLTLSLLLPGALAANGCFPADPECGSSPVDNCDVRQNTTFMVPNASLKLGLDICADDIVLDCNGTRLLGYHDFWEIFSGITFSGRSGVTVRNCNLVDYGGNAILADNAAEAAIEDNTVTSGGGISLQATENSAIRNNTLNGSRYGISLTFSSRGNRLIGNAITNIGPYWYGGAGISLSSASDNNLLAGNTLTAGPQQAYGLAIDNSQNNTLTGNHVSGHQWNLLLNGDTWSQTWYRQAGIDTTNLLDGRPAVYLTGARNLVVDGSANAGFFACVACSGVTVRDLRLAGNSHGVLLAETNYSLVENVTAAGNSRAGIHLVGGEGATIRSSNASGNGAWAASGILLEFANNATISGSIAADNHGGGIVLSFARGSRIERSLVQGNGEGISLSGSDESLIRKNTVAGNRQTGIALSEWISGPRQSFNVITGNNVSGNGRTGIHLQYTDNTTVSGNLVKGNTDTGILLYQETAPVLLNNTVAENRRGIVFAGNAPLMRNNTFSGNRHNLFASSTSITTPYPSIDTSNTVNGKPVYVLAHVRDAVFDEAANAGYFSCYNCTNITVRDLVLEPNDAGVFLHTVSGSVVENVTAEGNADAGIFLYSSSNNTIRGSRAHRTGPSLSDRGYGILIDRSDGNVVEDSVTGSNAAGGIHIIWARLNAVRRNTARNNTGSGIFLAGSSLTTVADNDASGNGYGDGPAAADGMYVVGSSNNVFIRNLVTNNSHRGLALSSGGSNMVSLNTLCANDRIGWGLPDLLNTDPSNTGFENTCQTWVNWQDQFIGEPGCTYFCTYPQLTVATRYLPNGTLGRGYSYPLRGGGGTPPYTFSAVGGLPAGLAVSPDGLLSGTPQEGGWFAPTLRVVDNTGATADKSLPLFISVTLPPPAISVGKWGPTPVPGRTLEYIISVTNVGVLAGQAVQVVELLQPGFFNYTSSLPGARVDRNTSVERLEWTIPSLQPGETALLTYTARLNASLPFGVNVTGGPVCGVESQADAPPSCAAFSFDSPEWFGLFTVGVPGLDNYCAPRGSDFHWGYDYPVCAGTSVRARYGGWVDTGPLGWGGEGSAVYIRSTLPNGIEFITIYGHISTSLQVGQWVDAGEVVGAVFDYTPAGCAGDHLHASMAWPLEGYNVLSGWERYAFAMDNSEFNKKTTCPFASSHDEEVYNRQERCLQESGVCTEEQQVTRGPVDPNEKGVLQGLYVRQGETMTYTIHFENVGTVEAQDVFIRDRLDPSLFNFSTLAVLTSQENSSFDPQTGTLAWDLLGINLPPNGTGSVSFAVRLRDGLPTGRNVTNNASIQFEVFPPLTTNSTLNIVDGLPPSCAVDPLPVNITNDLNLALSWSGADPFGEVESYTLFLSRDGGGYQPVISGTRQTSGNITGAPGTAYAFICIARDTAGNAEVQSGGAEASIRVNGPPQITSTPPAQVPNRQWYTYAAAATDPENQTVAFALAVFPPGMDINATTGLIRWFANVSLPPPSTANGSAGGIPWNAANFPTLRVPVEVLATDAMGLSASQAWNITVGVPPARGPR
ncbi:MAG: right-handed parallel beta-helix repeat-containing protein [Candidatus Aenigmarchaeota archaeon]|nr:right-handed parallel beta-helix repeat-containing protein [Candidatus Aenigmarchaeota archaeon]